MMGSMNCCGDLSTFNNMGIVVGDAERAGQAWAELFDFKLPPAVKGKEFFQSLYESGAAIAWPPIYRDKVWPMPEEDSAQYNIIQKKYAFEVKTAGDNNFAREVYDRSGNGVIYFGYSAGEARNYMVHHLWQDYGCEMINYMKYGEGDPHRGDWAAMNTEALLGVNLVLKKDGWSEYKTFAQMDDFDEVTIVVPDLKKAVKYWGNIFGIRTPIIRNHSIPVVTGGSQQLIVTKAARIREGAFRIVLLEAGESGLFSEFLSLWKNGGVYHVTLSLDQAEIAEKAQLLSEKYGVGVLLEYELYGIHYTVFDSRELLGINLCLYKGK